MFSRHSFRQTAQATDRADIAARTAGRARLGAVGRVVVLRTPGSMHRNFVFGGGAYP